MCLAYTAARHAAAGTRLGHEICASRSAATMPRQATAFFGKSGIEPMASANRGDACRRAANRRNGARIHRAVEDARIDRFGPPDTRGTLGTSRTAMQWDLP